MDNQIKVLNMTLCALLCAMIQNNLKNKDNFLSFIKFVYNRILHFTTNHSPFEIMYGFNLLNSSYLILLPFD